MLAFAYKFVTHDTQKGHCLRSTIILLAFVCGWVWQNPCLMKGVIMTKQELAALTELALIEAGYDRLFDVAVA